MKFLPAAKDELKEPFVVHSYFVREDHVQPFSVIMNRETVGGEDEADELVMMYDFSIFESPFRRKKEWFSSAVEMP